MGWNNPVGKRIRVATLNGRVIGVVRDFNFKSLHSSLEPVVLTQYFRKIEDIPEQARPSLHRFLILNVSGDDTQETLDYVSNVISNLDLRYYRWFEFVDNVINQLYTSDQHLMNLIGIFAFICIFIACLGLFGLAIYTTEQRTKEIGIRKILGATTSQIILILSENILSLVIIGSIIASASSWFIMNKWLMNFAYRTDISPMIFLVAMMLSITVAFITLALQSYKTASSNPVNALRYE